MQYLRPKSVSDLARDESLEQLVGDVTEQQNNHNEHQAVGVGSRLPDRRTRSYICVDCVLRFFEAPPSAK